MTSVLFIGCYNICRSPMAELILKDLAEKAGVKSQFHIESAGVCSEYEGSMLSEPARCLLSRHGIPYFGKAARPLQRKDYGAFDLLLAMDWAGFSRAREFFSGDPEHKIRLLLDFAERPGEIEDPEFSMDYAKTWKELTEGCQGLLDYFTTEERNPGKFRRVLCYGDSNTYGHDPRSLLGERYEEAVRWTALLRQKGWQIRNEGRNGRVIPYLKEDLETACAQFWDQETDIAVIMLGTNDLLNHCGLTAEVCARRMEDFLTYLLTEGPPCTLLLTAPPAMIPGAWIDDPRTLEESRRLPRCYETLAQKLGVAFVNAAEWNVSLTFDGVHFSKNGHRTFAAEMHRTLCAVLQNETP